MHSIQYEIILYWSREDQAFIALETELPGCAADGATYQEAVTNVEVVVREWIETAVELGCPVSEAARAVDVCLTRGSCVRVSDLDHPHLRASPGRR